MDQQFHPPIQLPLFVYGTLMRGEANFRRFLKDAVKTIRAATIQGRLYWYLPGDFPYVVYGEGLVKGELITIEPEHWPRIIQAIDFLEDYQPDDERESWYLRRQTFANSTEQCSIKCWTYYWNRPEGGTLIPSGDWHTREFIPP